MAEKINAEPMDGLHCEVLYAAINEILSLRSRAEKAEAEAEETYRREMEAVTKMMHAEARAGLSKRDCDSLQATCEKLAAALEPFAKVADAILAEAPADADYFSLFLDCEGISHRVTMDHLRAVSAVISEYRKEASE